MKCDYLLIIRFGGLEKNLGDITISKYSPQIRDSFERKSTNIDVKKPWEHRIGEGKIGTGTGDGPTHYTVAQL